MPGNKLAALLSILTLAGCGVVYVDGPKEVHIPSVPVISCNFPETENIRLLLDQSEAYLNLAGPYPLYTNKEQVFFHTDLKTYIVGYHNPASLTVHMKDTEPFSAEGNCRRYQGARG